MKANYSELQFTYSIVRELEDMGAWSEGPFFPTQRQEAHLGYDVRFVNDFVALFIQFKRSEMLMQSNAGQWGDFRRNYLRFDIYPNNRSHQHNNLVQLAQRNVRNRVYYCAPLFVELDELMEYHRVHTVCEYSVVVDCCTLPTIGGSDEHCICYANDPLRGYMYSEPKEIKIETVKEVYKNLRKSEYTYSNFDEFMENMLKLFTEEKLFCESSGVKDLNDFKENFNDYFKSYLYYMGLNFVVVKNSD